MSLTPKEDLERYCESVREIDSSYADYEVTTTLSEGEIEDKTDHLFFVRKSAGGIDETKAYALEFAEI
jgi:hypothetical protein